MSLLMGLIFFISHQPGDALRIPLGFHLDKLVHASVYALLAVSTIYAIKPSQDRFKTSTINIFIVLFCIIYGITDEWHQSFVPLRSPSIADIVADSLGAIIVVISWRRWW